MSDAKDKAKEKATKIIGGSVPHDVADFFFDEGWNAAREHYVSIIGLVLNDLPDDLKKRLSVEEKE